ncbi:hypothetical protein AMATHDRAFT_74265 [Amanita thiersii Skay4041]|uniref:Uncharacterized protein n=1 Tax=Amanita thiersii Skay4041 TaxID=703135 RepID=A0A2A9NPL3_9AGAR|nr:hypothetical protein AMATHDRAFT_74265 [Amanita thiersii Skay4041]
MASPSVLQYKHYSLPPVSRSIRFAPLPDPRRLVYVTDDGAEFPLPATHESAAIMLSSIPSSDDTSSLSSSGSSSHVSKRNSFPLESYTSSSTSSTPGTVTPVSSTTTTASSDLDHSFFRSLSNVPKSPMSPALAPKSPAQKTKAPSFLHPFLRRSTSGSSSPSSANSLTPTPSLEASTSKRRSRRFSGINISAEELLTLGTINLFRSVSRGTRTDGTAMDSNSECGWSLSRSSSVASACSAPALPPANAPLHGSPLARSQSNQSSNFNASTRHKKAASSSAYTTPLWRTSSAAPRSAPSSPLLPRKGVRMLNGRIYGGPKRPHSQGGNPFANARDEADPEFVEWGYGGMGSVSGRRAAGMNGTQWERLQGGQSGLMIGSCEGTASLDDNILDDGSGMGWVRRRREAREREKKEKGDGEQDKEVQEKGDNAKVESTETNTESITPPSQNSSDLTVKEVEKDDSTNQPNPAPLDEVPSPSRHESMSAASTSHSFSVAIPSEGEHLLHAVTIPAPLPRHHRSFSRGTIGSSLASDGITCNPRDAGKKIESSDESESDDESEELRGDEDSEEESEEEIEDAKRKTALGAGVEKFTRHKDTDVPSTLAGDTHKP